MPIDYSRYPPDWQERRARILERAGHKCEHCGVPDRWFRLVGETIDRDESYEKPEDAWDRMFERAQIYGDDPTMKLTRIILTIAHLDHDPENWEVADERLAALCQRCHLRYDAPEKRRRRAAKKYRQSLFPLKEH